MANDNLCVFCGEKTGSFRGTTVLCGSTRQTACRSCAREIEPLDDIDRCRRALLRGLADQPEKLRERIEFLSDVETHRPTCRCGGKLSFRPEQHLDNSPLRDSLLASTFDVLPACCEACGRYEFFHPEILRKNPHLNYLLYKDTK